MNIKQLDSICIKQIQELAPEIFRDEMYLSIPFFRLNGLMLKQGEKILSEDYQLTQSELDILASLYFSNANNFSLTPTELKEIMFFTSGGMTKLLKKLEDKKYIIRIDSKEDKRSKSVKITDKGKEITIKALKDMVEFEASYFSKLTKKEQALFTRLLDKMIQ